MSVTTTELKDFVLGVVSELSGSDRNAVKGEDRLIEDLGLDSLQSMELLSRASEEFDIDPDMEEMMGVSTIDDVVTALQRYVSAGAAA